MNTQLYIRLRQEADKLVHDDAWKFGIARDYIEALRLIAAPLIKSGRYTKEDYKEIEDYHTNQEQS